MLFKYYVTFLLTLVSQTDEAEEMNCRIFKNLATYNFVCPPDTEQKIELEVKPSDYIRIVCDRIELFDYSLLPDLNFGNSLIEFTMENCPIPENGFRDLLAKFNIDHLERLKFKWKSSNQSFQTEHFKGLEGLQNLMLFYNNVTLLNENLFQHMPNLIFLKLDENQITMLQDDIFKQLNVLLYMSVVENKISVLSRNAFRGLLRLKELDLINNKIKHIERGVFDELTDLEMLFLGSNKLHSLEDYTFINLIHLRYVHLERNELVRISKKLFQKNIKLEVINLERNTNLYLEDEAISQFAQMTSVRLSYNGLKTIPENLFSGSTNLNEIFLAVNYIKVLPDKIFQKLEHLEALYLNNNELKILQPNLFQSLKNLKILDLSHNLITVLHINLLDNLRNLEMLNLSFNGLKTIEPEILLRKERLIILFLNNNELDFKETALDTMGKCKHIKLINLANNSISQFPYRMMNMLVQNVNYEYTEQNVIQTHVLNSNNIEIILKNNNIPHVRFDYLMQENVSYRSILEVDISQNSIFCDCKASDLVAYTRHLLQPKNIIIKHENLQCAGPSGLENIPLDEVNEEDLSCSLKRNCTVTGECDCSYKSANKAFVVDCSRRNLTDTPKLLVADVVQYYDFIKLGQIDVHLEDNALQEGPTEHNGYFNITNLFLQSNNIRTIKWVPPFIKVLNLEKNELESLDNKVLSILGETNITELHLANNPWKCDCSTNQFHKFLRDHISQIYNATSIRCTSIEIPLVNMDEILLCPTRPGYVLVISSAILFCLIATITTLLLYLVYQKEIFIWLYSRGTCLWLIEEERIDKSKKYDAFVSFAHQDEDFVVERLLPVLENGEPAYKLCVHIRDWVPGEYITKQIANSVKDSRRTLIILSSDFLKSMWGKMEFRTAHTAAMEEGRVRVIIVIYGDLDITAVNDDLKSYMRTNTYIKWGDPWFWEKLKYALPRTRRRYKKPERRKRRNSADAGIELR